VIGEAGHSQGGGPSGTAVGAAEEARAARGAAVGGARAEISEGLLEREEEPQVT
jgi:hypothetical protein